MFLEISILQRRRLRFLSRSTENRGCWVGISEHVGHATIFNVLTDDIQNILFSSNLCSDKKLMKSNLRLDPICGEPYTFIKSCPNRYKKSVSHLDDYSRKDEQVKIFPMDETLPKDENYGKSGDTNAPRIPSLNSYDIIGCTSLMPPQEDGQRF